MSDLGVATDTTAPVTVVIATRDRPSLLKECLAAVSSVLRNGDGIIVVDSCSRSEEVRAVAEGAGAVVIRCDQPGASRARNAGWKAADTEIVAFTDDDCLPESGWLASLSAGFSGLPEAAFVTGRLVADSVERGRAEFDLSLFDYERPSRFELNDDLEKMGHGANMAWRREALEAVGGFDEEMGPGTPFRAAEDQDAFWRVLRHGTMGSYEPKAIVVHRQWRNRRQQLQTMYDYGIGSGVLEVKRWRLDGGEAASPQELQTRSALLPVIRRAGSSPLRRLLNNVRTHYEMGIVSEMSFLAGLIRGATMARRTGLSDGRWAI